MKLWAQIGAVAALGTACAAACAAGPTPDDCWKMRLHGQRAEANKCFETLAGSSDAYTRAEGFWGLGEYDDANKAFHAATDANGTNAMMRVRWGMLFHERFNDKDAADLFHEALALDAKNARAYLGQAIVSVDGQDNQAAKEELAKALELDPKLYEAHELLASIALEDSDEATAIAEADKAIAISADALEGYAVHAAAEVVVDRPPDAWIAKISAVNPGYGEGYALIAHDLELHYRYEDAITYYRKAIEADPTLWAARSELGVNLMRLGNEDEAMQQLADSYNHGETDALTSNSLKLLDSNKSFVTYKDDTTILKFRKKEADLLEPYFSAELHQILTTYDAKYKMKLPGPVQVEVYPDHEDFAVRTMGMPGLGALGVTFGEVIAMDSPSGRKPGDFNWGATLWHEMSHVYILTATNHRVPRWFTEGLAVHEEGARNPEWANRVTPEVLMAIRDKKLLPVAKLDRGFTSPEYPSQVIVSYFQAGAICDFIATKWGSDKLLGMVHSYTLKKPTVEAIQENLGVSADEFDKEFFASIDKAYGQEAHDFDTWRGILKGLVDLENQKAWELMEPQAQMAIQMYPEYVGDASAYGFLAEAQSELGDKKGAAATLMSYVKMGGEDPVWLKSLAHHEEELGDKKTEAEVLARLNYIYPVDEDLHRQLGDLLYEQKEYVGAVREYTAVVALNPLDKAGAEYNLARAYAGAGQKDRAETAVLSSLETAPGFKPAQELLLQIDGGGANSGSSYASVQPPASPAPSGGGIQVSSAEANAYNVAQQQTTPAAKAQALEAFLAQYPNTMVKTYALEQLVQAYAQSDATKVTPTADRLLQADPNNLRGLTMEVYFRKNAADQMGDQTQKQAALDQAADFAQKGLTAFANKPAKMSDTDFNQLKGTAVPTFYSTIGEDELLKGDAAGAVGTYTKELAAVPVAQTQTPGPVLADEFYLGQAYVQEKPQDLVHCAYYTARAANFAPEPTKAQMLKTAQYCYRKFHGKLDGFDQVQQMAAANLNPPADFKIAPAPSPEMLVHPIVQGGDFAKLSIADQEFILKNGTMTDANGVKDSDKVWATMKGKSVTIPDAVIIATSPSQLQVAVSEDAQQTKTADVTVTIKQGDSDAYRAATAVGSKVAFHATYDSYTMSPFMITMTGGEVQLPKTAAPAAPARPRAAGHTNTN